MAYDEFTAKMVSENARLKAANNRLVKMCDPHLTSAEVKAIDRHCDWVAFGHAYRALMNVRKAQIEEPTNDH